MQYLSKRVGSILLLISISLSISWSGKIASKGDQAFYDAILTSIAKGDLERADNEYLTLRSDFIDSRLLPTAMLVLAQAHMAKGEYLLARYYLNEFLKEYAEGEWVDYAQFLKIKSSFLSLRQSNRNQKLLSDTLAECKEFYQINSHSRYAPLIRTMIVRLEMAQYLLNEEIAHLYEQTGKRVGASIYRKKNRDLPYKPSEILLPSRD